MRITGINPYYTYNNKIPFKRSVEEHKSWGAAIDPITNEASFKLFTYPDTKAVSVKIYDEKNPEKYRTFRLKNMGNGVFTTHKNPKAGSIKPGDKYSYVIHKGNGEIDEVKDPYAQRQGNRTSKDFLYHSIIYDHSDFQWQNQTSWLQSNERIVRNPDKSQIGVESALIYEMQIDTFTQEGTFEAAKEKLGKIKDLGFNTIEIMPNENTFYYNWGYDGVDKFAPPEHRGGPDKLKELIDYAHGLNLNVVMDYVPNHLGADGAELKRTGPYVKGENDFGESFNFEGENSKYVRDYIVNAALNWVANYNVDGLRLDMTKFMESDFTMKQIAAEINHHFPDVFLIAEDSRQGIAADDTEYWEDYTKLHDARVTSPLEDYEISEGNTQEHCRYIDEIDATIEEFIKEGATFHPMLRNLGYDSEWDFSFHHNLDGTIFAYNNGSFNEEILENLVEAIYQSQKNVKYVTSHDETGNYDGTRPVVKYLVPKLNLSSYIILNNEDKKRVEDFVKLKNTTYENARYIVLMQKTQLACEGLTKLLSEGKLDSYKYKKYDKFYSEVLAKFNIRKDSKITYQRLLRSYERSLAQFRMAQALTAAIPGPKMVFQGDENLDITSFRFFREFEGKKYEDYLKTEKGYEPGEPALLASKLDGIDYSEASKTRMEQHANLTKDLNRLNKENPALTRGSLVINEDGLKDYIIHNNIIGLHTKDEETGNEFFIVTNFGTSEYPNIFNEDYYLQFPKGEWEEVLNTDNVKYGGYNKHLNEDKIFKGEGLNENDPKIPINLGEFSTVYFKRINKS